MKHLIEFKLPDGCPVYVEVEDSGELGPKRVGRSDVIEQAQAGFTESFARIRPAVDEVLQVLHDLNTPAEIALEFGIKFNAKAGVIIASVDSEATFKVALKWTNKQG